MNSTSLTEPSLSLTAAVSVMGWPKAMVDPPAGEASVMEGGAFVPLATPGVAPLANQLMGSLPYAVRDTRCSEGPRPSAPGGHGRLSEKFTRSIRISGTLP